nr:dephospho-CoA kinase domain-containing protein isoform X2 [Taeniopygia guttata]XP_041577416.1 dephospho-CoA kinase domain-containing protein isoform X2 [Taeniopygia guttata]
MFLVGLSGGIASGKSTVVAVLRELGCAVIDADVIARQVVQPHSKAHQQILQHFGPEILLENGEINREALGSIIFSQPEKRRLLNSITHPEILKEMLKQVLKYFVLGYRYVILDIPLLFETRGLTRFMKYTVLVYCDPPAPRHPRAVVLFLCPPSPPAPARPHGTPAAVQPTDPPPRAPFVPRAPLFPIGGCRGLGAVRGWGCPPRCPTAPPCPAVPPLCRPGAMPGGSGGSGGSRCPHRAGGSRVLSPRRVTTW